MKQATFEIGDDMRPTLTLRWKGKTDPVPDVTFVEVTEPAPPPPLRPVHVLEVTPLEECSPLQICLNHWRTWMHRNDRDLGAKTQAGFGGGRDDEEGYDDSAAACEAAIHRASREIAMATDAMIDSLPRHYKAAIYRSCNIVSVWRFPNLDFTVTLPEAEKELIGKLSKNVATRTFF